MNQGGYTSVLSILILFWEYFVVVSMVAGVSIHVGLEVLSVL